MGEAVLTITSSKNFRGLELIKGKAILRSAKVLTDSYVDTNYANMGDFTSVALCFEITKASLTSFEYQVYMSLDGNTWFLENTETITASIITDSDVYYTKSLSADTTYYKIIQVPAPYIKLSVKGTGAPNGSSCAVTIMGVR